MTGSGALAPTDSVIEPPPWRQRLLQCLAYGCATVLVSVGAPVDLKSLGTLREGLQSPGQDGGS